MFCLKQKPYLNELLAKVNSDTNLKKIYSALKQDAYRILFRFDSISATLFYTAFLKDPSLGLPSLIELKVDSEGKKQEEEFLGFKDYDFNAEDALYAYIIEKESLSNEDELKEVYGKYYHDLKELYSLPTSTLRKRENLRSLFNAKVVPNIGNKDEPSSKQYGIYVSIYTPSSFGHFYQVFLDLVIGDKQRTKIKNLNEFFEAYLDEKEVKISKILNLYVKRSLFQERDQQILDFLAQHSALQIANQTTSYQIGSLSLSDEEVLKLLCLLASSSCYYGLGDVLVEGEIQKAGFYLDELENPVFVPPLDSLANKKVIVGSSYIAVFMAKTSSIVLYHFENKEMGLLYSFFYEFGISSYPLVKDLFKKAVGKSLNPIFIKKQDKSNDESDFSINLYLDIDKYKGLSFVTKFMRNGESEPKESFTNNLYYDSLIHGYEAVLRNMECVENGIVSDGNKIVSILNSDFSELKNFAHVFCSDRIKALSTIQKFDVKIKTKWNSGVFSLDLLSDKFSKEELLEIFKAYKEKRTYLLLGRSLILLDNDEIEKLVQITKEVDLDPLSLKKSKASFFEAIKLLKMEDDNIKIELDDYLASAINDIANFKELDFPLSPFLSSEIRNYQVDASRWMSTLYKYNLGGILADDMGLGKSLETIAFIDTIKKEAPILIVCPKSIVYNWVNEFLLWSPKTTIYPIDGSKGEREVLIKKMQENHKAVFVISYDSLRNDIEKINKAHFSLLILDEAQYIKNTYAAKSQAVKGLVSDGRFALTGTPIENSLSDLWSIFDFLMPGFLNSYTSFKEKYQEPIQNRNDMVAKDHLLKQITPFILRREKKDVLFDLPKKTMTIFTVSLDDEDQTLYDSYCADAKAKLEMGDRISVLALLTKLREICVDPSSFIENYKKVSTKLSFILDKVQESIYNGHKILVFSSFRRILDHLRMLLDKEGVASYCINGDTPTSYRMDISKSFNSSDDVKVLLVSLKAGGTGLNLQGADVVIHLDPWWNFAAEEQATDRAYRIGQKRPVNVYKIVCHNSIEEKVVELQNKKKNLYKAVIKSGEEGISNLTLEDMAFLLGIKK
jgi:SNF2 family DNA or RNA helicase